MLEKLQAIANKYSEVEARLNAPETYNDPALVGKLNREQRELAPLVEAFHTLEKRKQEMKDAEVLFSDRKSVV